MDSLESQSNSIEQLRRLREVLAMLANEPASASDGEPSEERIELLEQLLGERLCRQLAIYRLPVDFFLSVVIPIYNEVTTLEGVIQRVRATGIPSEIILVDDGSTDGTRDVLQRFQGEANLKICFHPQNQGKGSALRTGFLEATGDVVVIQDADWEYDPQDFWWLLQPILEGEADIVYGTRFRTADRHIVPLWHQSANRLITWLSNLKTGRTFSDVETCYKMFRREVIQEIAPTLRERGFGIEIELTQRLARRHRWRFFERPIRYTRRSYAEGKKIDWRDGLWALWCILRY